MMFYMVEVEGTSCVGLLLLSHSAEISTYSLFTIFYDTSYSTNHHPGNKRYRKLVESRKCDYVNSKRLDKPLVAFEIIREWRGQDPPGRFLKLDDEAGLWYDVGDKKAREKTSQALREKTPQVKKQQDVEKKESFQNHPLERRQNVRTSQLSFYPIPE